MAHPASTLGHKLVAPVFHKIIGHQDDGALAEAGTRWRWTTAPGTVTARDSHVRVSANLRVVGVIWFLPELFAAIID